MQKTQRRSRTSNLKFWWLWQQGRKRQLRISKQSSICSLGAGSGHSMDPGVSVQKQNFTRNPEKLSKVPGTREETKSHLQWQFLGIACEDLSWNHCTSPPHQSETNGVAERAVRRVKEGTSVVLLQTGLNSSWWADSMECYTYLRNVTDLLSDGKTPYERRFGQPFKGPIIPFGSLVEYHPVTAKDQSRIHQFGKKVLPGLFFGCATLSTRGEFGRVTYQSQTLRSWRRWTHRKSNRKDSMRKRWYFPKRICFSNRRWTNQNPWRRSGTENIHFGTASPNSRRGSRWLSWRNRRVSSTSSRRISGCRERTKWFLVHVRSHRPDHSWDPIKLEEWFRVFHTVEPGGLFSRI